MHWRAVKSQAISARLGMLRLLSSVAPMIALLGHPRFALAQVSPSAKAEAVEHYNSGFDAMVRGDRERAYSELTASWKLDPSAETAGLLGQTECNVCASRSAAGYCELYVDAARHLTFALNNIPAAHRADTPVKLNSLLAEVKAQIGRLQIEAPAAAQVFVDGKMVGIAPISGDIFVAPGTHAVEARLNGTQLPSEHIDIEKGSVQRVRIANASPDNADKLILANQPGTASKNALPEAKSKRSIEPRTVTLWTGVGVTLAAAGIGSLFAIKASSANDDAKNARFSLGTQANRTACDAPSPESASACNDLSSALDRRNSHHRAQNISFVVAGVSAVATAILFYAWPTARDGARSALRVAPSLSPSVSGLDIYAVF